jgi:hypothetical protein
MVIESTRLSGAANGPVPVELGEWGAREMARERQDPGLRHAPIRITEPEGALRVTIAWARPLCATRNAVQFATERVCEQ